MHLADTVFPADKLLFSDVAKTSIFAFPAANTVQRFEFVAVQYHQMCLKRINQETAAFQELLVLFCTLPERTIQIGSSGFHGNSVHVLGRKNEGEETLRKR